MTDSGTRPEIACDEEFTSQAQDSARAWKKLRASDLSDCNALILTAKRPWISTLTGTDKPVRIFSYTGWPANSMGSDGDFFVEEMNNILYGPKTDGIWPEDGVPANGICKRSFIGLHAPRLRLMSQPARESRLRRGIKGLLQFFRWCVVGGARLSDSVLDRPGRPINPDVS